MLGSCAPVAQLDRASGFEPEGRAFESLRAHHEDFQEASQANVAELADALDLGSSGSYRAGSSPAIRTINTTQ